MRVKKTIWRPLVLGLLLGTLAGITTVTGLSFLTPGITENAIGFFGVLLLLATALGGPLSGVIGSTLFVIIVTLFGPPDMKAILSDSITFWSNVVGVGITVALVGFGYRFIFERLKMPARLLAWAGIVIGYYILLVPATIIPQYLLHGNTTSEILQAVLFGYQSYFPQAIFDIFITSLVFIALPSAYTRPLWYEPRVAPDQDDDLGQDVMEEVGYES